MPVYEKNGLIYCVYYDNGRRVWEPYGRGPQARAAAETRDLEIKLKKRRGQWHEGSSAITYLELLNLYISARQTTLSSHTWDGILRATSTYAAKILYPVPINRITMDHWLQIQAGMIAKRLKNRTINTYFKYISHPLTWAVNEAGLLERHPWSRRKALKEEKFDIRLFSIHDFLKIMWCSGPHLAWAMEIAYYTGARPGPKELFSLTWDRLDPDRSAILLDSAKTSNGTSRPTRWQYIPPNFMRRLLRYKKATLRDYPDCRHVCHYEGQPIKSLKTAWRNAKRRAHISAPIRLYDIRHYHITYALAGGADIRDLAERVGHTTPKMIVNVYSHLAKDVLKNRAHTLPDLAQNPLAKGPTVEKIVDENKKAVSKDGLSC